MGEDGGGWGRMGEAGGGWGRMGEDGGGYDRLISAGVDTVHSLVSAVGADSHVTLCGSC